MNVYRDTVKMIKAVIGDRYEISDSDLINGGIAASEEIARMKKQVKEWEAKRRAIKTELAKRDRRGLGLSTKNYSEAYESGLIGPAS